MSRKLVAICLVLAMASVSFAGVLVTSWEDPTNGEISSWGAAIVPGQTIGVTDGTYSDGIVCTTGWGFIGQVAAISGNPTGAQLDAGLTTMEMDVTVVGADWSGDNGFQFGLVINSGGTGWQQADVGSWYWGGGTGATGADFTEHLTWNFSSLMTGPSGGWAQIILYQNSYSHDGSMGSAIYYIDNLQLTPEPATMALLGLGGLALIRRKK
jgi:hypothetical protein